MYELFGRARVGFRHLSLGTQVLYLSVIRRFCWGFARDEPDDGQFGVLNTWGRRFGLGERKCNIQGFGGS